VTPTRAALAEYNRGVERARRSYRADPLAASRQEALGRIRAARHLRRITRDEYDRMIAEVAEW
jgi:hypothetical protein